MSRTNTHLIKAALRTFEASGAARLTAPFTRGIGAIFMLHNVGPDTGLEFEPNRFLRITPEFLEEVIGLVRDMGFDTVSLDEIPDRLAAGRDARPFVAFTFDDGYRDNRDHALPVMKKHDVPMAIYVPSDFADGSGDLWWLNLENAIRRLDAVDIAIGDARVELAAATTAEKKKAFHHVYWLMRDLPEAETRHIVRELCRHAGIDPDPLCRQLVMDWQELRELSREPLVTLGAHTTGHFALGKLDAKTARRQMADSIARIEDELDLTCRHFSYPYGSATACGQREFELAHKLGMRTAVTTAKGLIHARHRDCPTALPRVSLNGDFQDLSLVRTLLTGAPFAMLQAYEAVTSMQLAARAYVTPGLLVTST